MVFRLKFSKLLPRIYIIGGEKKKRRKEKKKRKEKKERFRWKSIRGKGERTPEAWYWHGVVCGNGERDERESARNRSAWSDTDGKRGSRKGP